VLVQCNVHIHLHPPNEKQEQLTLLEEGGTLALLFEWRGTGAHCLGMEMSQRTYHGTVQSFSSIHLISSEISFIFCDFTSSCDNLVTSQVN